ncbi:MAG TPA: VOC family protein [Vicinamibacterales bacterium]|jgi:catechol 2,3-dioxygenase-like lactoylglutathione lyase family enzyme|nr:VOC family protein [Vicinamibacterales bacterium]
MSDYLATLFNDFDRGKLSRRQLLMALGLAAAIRPASAFAQGRCGGERAGTPDCDTTPAKLPFEATGWKTVLLDHFSCQVADYPKEAAYYAALMNWKIRSDDGKQAVLDIGDWGGLVLRGGYQAPPAPPASAAPAAAGGGRGGPRAPRNAVFDSFCWGIEPWDAKTVEAALRKRGLTPVADDRGKDFQSFHVKDPDGFDLQISNGSRKNRRQGAASGKTSAPAPFASTNWKTVWLDHISFEVSNYKETVAFYSALLGWKPGTDEGSQNQCEIGDVGDVIIRRGGGGGRGAAPAPTARHAQMGHIAFGITPFDPDEVKAELTKRGLSAREDTGARGDIHTASYKSYHTTTPNGFDLQISATTKANRNPA